MMNLKINKSISTLILALLVSFSLSSCLEPASILNPSGSSTLSGQSNNNATSGTDSISGTNITIDEDTPESQGTVTGNPKSPEIESSTPFSLPVTIAKAVTPNALKTKGSLVKSSVKDSKSSKVKITGTTEAAVAKSTIYYYKSDTKTLLGSTTAAEDGSFEIDVDEDLLDEKIDIAYHDDLTDASYISIEVFGEDNWQTSISQAQTLFNADVAISNGNAIYQSDNGMGEIHFYITPVIGGETVDYSWYPTKLNNLFYAHNSPEIPSYSLMQDILVGTTLEDSSDIVRLQNEGAFAFISDPYSEIDPSIMQFAYKSYTYPDSGLFTIAHGVSLPGADEYFIFSPIFNPTQYMVDDAAFLLESTDPFVRIRDLAWHDSGLLISLNKQVPDLDSPMYDPSVTPAFDATLIEFDRNLATDMMISFYDMQMPDLTIAHETKLFSSKYAIRNPVASHLDDKNQPFFLYVCTDKVSGQSIENICMASLGPKAITKQTSHFTLPITDSVRRRISDLTISKNNEFAAFVYSQSETQKFIYIIHIPSGSVYPLFSDISEKDATSPSYQLQPKFSDSGDYDLFFLSGSSETSLQGNVIDLSNHKQSEILLDTK